MLKIGEAAKLFDISSRTLRYWEGEGILRSARAENGYRFYDDENATRIRQIVLLRRLKVPIADIERLLIANDVDRAIDILTRHLASMRRKAADAAALGAMVDALIQRLRAGKDFAQVLSHFEPQGTSALCASEAAPQILLSEGNASMNASELTNVRIVNLPAMTVASYCAQSETPEDDCSAVMDKFILENSLHKKSCFRHFGFNNPSPSEGNPVYGYEIWVAIPEDFGVPAPLTKKRFGGGLYASIATSMGEIGERWRQLYEWATHSDQYDVNLCVQWLEECIDYETFISDDEGAKQLDLLEPIRKR